jgi:hypothetical protein
MPASQPPATSIALPRSAWLIAAAGLGLHLLPRPGYGFHRDELLYLAMGDHLDPLRMQFNPAIAFLAEGARALPLPLLSAIHLLSALAVAALTLLTARLAGIMGGNGRAQLLAALGVLVAPLFLRAGALFQPVVFEQLWWTLGALALASLLAGRGSGWWIILGLTLGLGALTKFSVAFFALGVTVAVLLSPLRGRLATRGPWLALLVAVAVGLPSILGQLHWGWPFLEQARLLRAGQLEIVTRGAFVGGQLFMAGAATPLLLAGALGLALSRVLRPYRPLGLLAVTVFLLLLALHGKDYYFGPLHPTLLAAGAVVVTPWLSRRRTAWPVALGFLVVGGALLLPLGIPLLPPEAMVRYTARLGITRAVVTNSGTVLSLPQDYADMLGWREQAAAVAAVYHALPESERRHTVIVAGNYGRAGALAVYRQEFDLPYPVSRSGDFYNWGPGQADAEVVIVVGGSVEELSQIFGQVTMASRVANPRGVEEEQDVGIHLCRLPKKPLGQLWLSLGPDWG